MTVKVRSSEGESLTNDSTPDINSPSSITSGDLLVIIFCMNDDTVAESAITPPSGFSAANEVTDSAVGDRGMRYIVWTKVATATDASNQGTANYYAFSGLDGVVDILYGIFSLYDDGGGDVSYLSSSLADNHETGGGTSTNAPTQTISNDGSLGLCCWAGRQGDDYFDIGNGTAYSPAGGANATLHHGGWTGNTQSALEWVVGTAEWDVSDSPIGAQTVTHQELAANVDQYSVSMIFQAPASSGFDGGSGRGVMRGVMRGFG